MAKNQIIRKERYTVTSESSFCCCTTGPNKSRDKLLRQGIVTLFRKPAEQKDSGLVSQRAILTELEFRLLSY